MSESPLQLTEIVGVVEDLRRNGKLVSLRQPDLRMNKTGRPKVEPSSDTQARARGFLERMKDISPQEACLRDVIAGQQSKNAGGKGVKKTCKVS